MNQCPRAWILKYGFRKNRGTFNRHLRNIADWSTPWRLMQRALRGVIIERLECHSNQKLWIEKDLASKIRHRIIGAISRQKSVIEVVETRIGNRSQLRRKIKNSEIDRLVEIACYRYHAAMSTEPISMILDGQVSTWYTFSRLEKFKFDKFQLHLAPDLVWLRGIVVI
jgi:predicted XRE-type DNA-binding protein